MFTDIAQNCNGQRSKTAQNDLHASSMLRRVTGFDEVRENATHDREGYN
jgi:hypothetical protein